MAAVSAAGRIQMGMVVCATSFAHFGKFFVCAYGELGDFAIDGLHDVSINTRMASLVGGNAQAASICTFAGCSSFMEKYNCNDHVGGFVFVRLLFVDRTDGCATICAALVVSCFDICPSGSVGRQSENMDDWVWRI